jgi:4-aminobutyrate aminotransferase-like enzyme
MIGKGIGGGLPLSMIVARKDILNNWGPLAHLSTFAGYRLGCAVSLQVFEIIEKENLLKRSQDIGKYFYEGLLDLQNEFEMIGDVTGGKGIFLALELVKNRKTKDPAMDEMRFIVRKCVDDGLILQPSGYFYNRITFIPALTITKDSIDKALDILKGAFKAAEKEFNYK